MQALMALEELTTRRLLPRVSAFLLSNEWQASSTPWP